MLYGPSENKVIEVGNVNNQNVKTPAPTFSSDEILEMEESMVPTFTITPALTLAPLNQTSPSPTSPTDEVMEIEDGLVPTVTTASVTTLAPLNQTSPFPTSTLLS